MCSIRALGVGHYNIATVNPQSESQSNEISKTLSFSEKLVPLPPTNSFNTMSAMNILTQEKQQFVLSLLNKMELHITNDFNTHLSSQSMTISRPIKTSPAYNIQYAFENKIQYGHCKPALERVNKVLRKLREKIEEMTEEDRKKVIECKTQRGYVELLGPTALRERILQDLSVNVSPKDISVLIKKFDQNNCGLINIADVYGNAILISSSLALSPIQTSSPFESDIEGEIESFFISRPQNSLHGQQKTIDKRKKKSNGVSSIGTSASNSVTLGGKYSSISPSVASSTAAISLPSQAISFVKINGMERHQEKCIYKKIVTQLAQISDDVIASRLSHTGFNTQLYESVLPYLHLSSSPTQKPSSAQQLKPRPQSTTNNSTSSISTPHRFIVSYLELEYLFKDLYLFLNPIEMKVLLSECKDKTTTRRDYNAIDIVKLFQDRQTLKNKCKLEAQPEQNQATMNTEEKVQSSDICGR